MRERGKPGGLTGSNPRSPVMSVSLPSMLDLVVLAQETTQVNDVTINLTLPGIIAVVAGIIILLVPRVLNYVVAIYLIVVGLIQIFDITL
jgi:hypothetical protein